MDIDNIVGEQSIEVHIGAYRSLGSFYLLVTDITVSYGFDEDSTLIDIWVRKFTDAP